MLGLEIADPYQIESNHEKIAGLGLLNIKTVFQQKKVTTQVKAIITDDDGVLEGLQGVMVEGYEIHMGTTEYLENSSPYLTICSAFGNHHEKVDGVRNGNVLGTYIHGIFDNMMDFTLGLINNLRKRKGLEKTDNIIRSFKEFKEEQYNKLADLLRDNLDMARIYKIINL